MLLFGVSVRRTEREKKVVVPALTLRNSIDELLWVLWEQGVVVGGGGGGGGR